MDQATLDKTARNIVRETLDQSMGGDRRSGLKLHVCGLNHVRAQIAVRERYALSGEQAGQISRRLRDEFGAGQALVLSTCNRTEIYAFSARPRFGEQLREAFLEIGEELEPAAGPPPIYEYEGIEAARHLFAVGAGLDSMILGENQIKQQIHQAWRQSQELQSAGPELHRLVEAAHRCGKRIRTETELNVGTLCVGKAAVLRGEQVLGGLAGRTCMVIGAGKVGRIAARAIAERNPGRLLIVNRTLEHAGQIAAELDGLAPVEAHGIECLDSLLPRAEFILGAAYAPELILDWNLYQRVAADPRRPERVCMIDAAVPRIFDPALSRLAWVELLDIEHMTEIIEVNRRRRTAAAGLAWLIVEEEIEKYRAARHAAALAPIIKRLSERFDDVFTEETILEPDDNDVACARELAQRRRLKQRLLHEAIVEIKSLFEQADRG